MRASILDDIVAQKRVEVGLLPQRRVTPELVAAARKKRACTVSFAQALRQPLLSSMALIAEVKKASPSAGIIRDDFDPVRIARQYEMGGANCLSVLTDVKFFQGSMDYLRQIRSAVKLPLLRKDFIIDSRQILEAAEAGADAILLIVAILKQEQLRELLDLTRASGLTALVEVHDDAELERALDVQADVIGINNRNLKDFKVNLATTEALAPSLRKQGILVVAESGIHHRSDVTRVENAGAHAILVGESLMRESDVQGKIRDLLGVSGA